MKYNRYTDSLHKIYFNMLSKPINKKLVSEKRANEEIEKSLYYRDSLFKELFPNPTASVQSAKFNKVTYYYATFQASNQILSNTRIIHSSAQRTYLNDFQIQKIDSNMYKREVSVKLPYLLIFTKAQQVFKIHISSEEVKGSISNDNELKKQLYVIHYCSTSQDHTIKWLHFVERYVFSAKSFEYDVTIAIKSDDNLLGTNQKLFEEYLKAISLEECPKRMEGFLLQEQINLKIEIKKSNDPVYSNQHRVLNRINPENIKFYSTLQKQFPALDQNLICRYLIAKQYNLVETRKSITQYLQWRQKITAQWKYEDFEDFHKLGIFYYLGEDRSGRPVILNRACRVVVDEIDVEKYSYYYIYYLEIYIPSLMRGNVSQIMIIADVENLSSANFKFSLTRKNMEDNLKYSPQRQYKIIGINVSSFALYWWRLFSPLIPKKSLEKIVVAGANKESIYQALENEMPAEIIPEYLGGKNSIKVI